MITYKPNRHYDYPCPLYLVKTYKPKWAKQVNFGLEADSKIKVSIKQVWCIVSMGMSCLYWNMLSLLECAVSVRMYFG